MTYLVADNLPDEPAGLRFRRLVERSALDAALERAAG